MVIVVVLTGRDHGNGYIIAGQQLFAGSAEGTVMRDFQHIDLQLSVTVDQIAFHPPADVPQIKKTEIIDGEVADQRIVIGIFILPLIKRIIDLQSVTADDLLLLAVYAYDR